ncbi:hypothetical protein [Erwinia sp. HR93]|uniref:hypothetical protein n=1 Tax=Erwinia sp. HR93 TaxID=3094840 RepID=UPI002ADEC44F|nr:hypothetical protein [Erwinia sp. HR93]MEA1064716.1 hypothetical protein [Erwinia sp. HR93]
MVDTKQLVSIIERGEQLRDEMRRTAESKDAIIRRQAGKLKNITQLNRLLRERRNRAAKRLNVARNETRNIRGRLEKQRKRDANEETFHAAVKAAANEMGIWKELRDRALLLVSEKDNSLKKCGDGRE